jgi:hypothetical protein
LNGGETKPVTIDLPKSSGSSRFGFMPTLGSTSTLYVSLWMDPPGNANATTDARYAYPVDAVNINSQQLL